jgi:hypothetical protein
MKFMSLTFPDWTFHVSHYLAILIIQELHADLGYLLLKEKKNINAGCKWSTNE